MSAERPDDPPEPEPEQEEEPPPADAAGTAPYPEDTEVSVVAADATPPPEGVGGAVAAVGRWVSAVLFSAFTAGILFLVVVEEGGERGFTDVAFNHSLGVMIGGEAGRARADEAFGVSGDTAAPTGLIWFSVACLVVMAVHGLTIHRLVRRPWYVQGPVLGLLVYLLVSLVYFPLINASDVVDVSVGPFGVGGGGSTPLLFLVGSLAFGMLGARVFSLAASAHWWLEKEIRTEAALSKIEGMEELEADPIPEERQRGESSSGAPM